MLTLRRTCVVLSFLLALGVRPISDAERAAVDHAATYLSGGPEALVARLASTSPLKKLGAADAAKELEVRLGPNSGATWELQTVVPALAEKTAVFDISFPSGVDETAIFDLKKEGDEYKIDNVRILSEESPNKPVFAAAAPIAPTDTKPAEQSKLSPALFALIACVLGIAAAFLRRPNKTVAQLCMTAAAIGAVAAIGVAALTVEKKKVETTTASVATDTYPRLAPLLDLRRSIAAGTETNFRVSSQKTDACRNAAKLWKAQMDLQQMRVDEAKHALATFAEPSSIPQVEILRGRVALFEQDESRSAIAYEHAVSLGPGRDGLWAETAHALFGLGYEERGIGYLERLDRIGTRDSDIYYMLSMYKASQSKDDDAEKYLNTAWTLHPAQRAQVVGAPVLWSVIRKPATASFVNLSTPEEAVVSSPSTGTRPITFPANAQPRVSGDFLDVQIGEQELRVPGGASLAPAGTQAIDAEAWNVAEEEKYLSDYTRIVSAASSTGAYTNPVLRRRITSSALALAERNRWDEVLKLTDGVNPKSEHIPPMLFFLRATALERKQRVPEAKELLSALAAGRVLQRKHDAQSLEYLGQMLASLDLYDAAVKMLDRAESIHQNERIEYAVAQINMNKRLATKYSTLDTDHFEVHYPDDVDGGSAKMIGGILEDELKRMQAWIPTPDFKKVVVNVVWWKDFRSVITGNDFTVGLYQGKITVPLAGVPIYPPEIVAILTHELTHAMLAQATHDQAPRWFQEGMAKRMEMVGMTRNAFNMYDEQKMLALSLLDPVLRESPDPDMIGEGYLISEAAVRYLEAKYGKPGMSKMIEQYRDGATTEAAIHNVTGLQIAEFDRQFRQWGRSETRTFETPIAARYDADEDIDIHMKPGAARPVAAQQPNTTQQQQQPQRKLTGGSFYPMKKP